MKILKHEKSGKPISIEVRRPLIFW